MTNRKCLTKMFVVFVMLALPVSIFAITLLTKEQALKEMFPDSDKIETQNRVLTAAEISAVKARLGGKLIHFQKGSASKEVEETTKYDFYFGIKDNQKASVAVIEEQPGKWGPVEFIILLDPNTAKVKNLAVMSYQEKRGRPIARKNFLDQFVGKGSEDALAVRKDIRAISGATISSDCACFAVKKVIALYETLFLQK